MDVAETRRLDADVECLNLINLDDETAISTVTKERGMKKKVKQIDFDKLDHELCF